jgi:hypothetical protein
MTREAKGGLITKRFACAINHMATVKGYLQLKKKSALKDTWHTYLCEYSSKKRVLTVKSKDGAFVFWEKEIDKAW